MYAQFGGPGAVRIAGAPSQIAGTRFATTHLPPRQQFRAWQRAVEGIVDITPAGPAEAGFAARMVAWNLDPLTLVRYQVPAAGFSRGRNHIGAGIAGHWCLVLPLDGAVTIETAAGRHTITAGTMGLYSLSQPFRGTTTVATILGLVVPQALWPEAAPIIEPELNTILGSSFARLIADFFIDLEARLPSMPASHLPAILEATRAMLVSCVAHHGDDISPSVHAMQFERARSYIRRNLNEPELNVDGLCQELRLSRSSLYRLFEAEGGVVQYIRSCRLLDAHRAFETGQDFRRIQEIAMESGFHDPAAFSRAFKRKFGYSPSQVRGNSAAPLDG